MSPRTKFVHLGQNTSAFGTVCRIVHQRPRLGSHLLSPAESNGVHQCLANCFRRRRSIGHQHGKRLSERSAFRKFSTAISEGYGIVRRTNYIPIGCEMSWLLARSEPVPITQLKPKHKLLHDESSTTSAVERW